MPATLNQQIFRQYDVRGIVGRDLTPDVARALGRAYAAFLAERGVAGAVAVGRDNRPSGDALREALVDGLTGCGVDVVDVGVVPTPLLYWTLFHEDVVGGIQITGSHNPPEYNGFKLSVGRTSIHGEDIQRLHALAVAGTFPTGRGGVRTADVRARYVDDVVARTGPLSRPLRVVADYGNGVGAVVGPQLLERLGARVTHLYAESDGTFPNHHPDPTVVENVQDLIAAVRREGADLGVAFDGDADRIGLVDASGEIVWGDHILILYARDVLARTGSGQSVIFDVKCSQALPDAVRAAGGVPVMWKTGHSLIKDKMKELHAPIAGEMSGHMFFDEGFYGHDDALYGAARLLRIVADSGMGVAELLADVPKVRVDAGAARRRARGAQVRDRRRRPSATSARRTTWWTWTAVRVLFGDGWGLIRASNTQPVLVMRFEASRRRGLDEIRAVMEAWLRAQGVDPTPGVGH
jgi:phosphomannomutase/phosphoglucomutase